MKNKIKVGSKVYSLLHGWGRVIKINMFLPYPITVEFENSSINTYTLDGRAIMGSSRTLLIDNPNIENLFINNEIYTFKEFLENNNIDFNKFIENCYTENQKWTLDDIHKYYKCNNIDDVKKLYEVNPINIIINAFRWSNSFFNTNDMVNLHNNWIEYYYNNKPIKFM